MSIGDVAGGLLIMLVLAFIFLVPFFSIAAEVICLVFSIKASPEKRREQKTLFFTADILIIALAVSLELFYMSMSDVMFESDWHVQLYNAQKHAPIYSGSLPTVIVILVMALAGFCILNLIDVNRTPPLIPVIAMSMLYAGLIFAVVFTYHIMWLVTEDIEDLYLLLPPAVFFLMSFRVIHGVITEYKPPEITEDKTEGITVIGIINRVFSDAGHWPIFALVFMLPLLGVIFCMLMLFGQVPDAAIKAFTETADFRLSEMIPPQNLYYDEHYLCTVAAGGDRRIVKPLRMGIRHDHKVVVNRQLCIANAFEQILEERTPRIHHAVRGFYDAYGFPVAKLIKKKSTADMVYILMKPLEWIFLIVIYLTDVHPEDRIAMQYTGKNAADLLQNNDSLKAAAGDAL